MTTFYRTFTYMVLFYALMAMSFVGQAKAQVVCTNLGAFTDCSGPGIDQTQVRTGPQTGVIITDRDTMPYTFLNPSRSTFDPTPLPSLTPNASTQPAPSQAYPYGNSYGSSAGMGAYGAQYGIILGQ